MKNIAKSLILSLSLLAITLSSLASAQYILLDDSAYDYDSAEVSYLSFDTSDSDLLITVDDHDSGTAIPVLDADSFDDIVWREAGSKYFGFVVTHNGLNLADVSDLYLSGLRELGYTLHDLGIASGSAQVYDLSQGDSHYRVTFMQTTEGVQVSFLSS